MSATATAANNFIRLMKHLKQDSLAAELVQAHLTAGDTPPLKAMAEALQARQEKIRKSLDDNKD